MPAQVTFLDAPHYGVDDRRLCFTALTAFHNQDGSAQRYNFPMSLGIRFNLTRKGGMLGKDTGINNTKYLAAFRATVQKYRGQQRVLRPEDIPAKKKQERCNGY